MMAKLARSVDRTWLLLHSYNVRVCHWINVIAAGYLLLSGIHIFLDFPELYWGNTGYQGYPAIFKPVSYTHLRAHETLR